MKLQKKGDIKYLLQEQLFPVFKLTVGHLNKQTQELQLVPARSIAETGLGVIQTVINGIKQSPL